MCSSDLLDGSGTYGVTGQYMTGFFPIMMFGLPGAALAMYVTAKTSRRKVAAGVLFSSAVAAFFVGAILIALVFVFIGRVVLMQVRGEADLGMRDIVEPLSILPIRLGLIGLTILFTIAIDWGGFTLTSFVFMAVSMIMLNRGRSKGLATLVAACFSLTGYLLFIIAFEIRFPHGPFENLIDGLF